MDFIKRFGEDTPSKKQAVERLRLVLVHDRARVSPGLMEKLREDIIKAITRYIDIDEDKMEIELNSTENRAELVANIPVNRIRRVPDKKIGEEIGTSLS
ncbi:MAG TPA: cell division topological specificity factor MinE [Firmicutes bacterium]|nr:cell division topological specificity factor MinE [Bacillota bacterium]